MRELATERLRLKAIALLVAALLWVLVSARQPAESYAQVQVVPELDSTLVMVGGAPEVRAFVSGRAADLVKLYAAPLVVRRRIDGDAPDTLVLDITPSDVHVPPELADEIRVLDVQPRNVVLRFETSASRTVRVENDGRIMVRSDSGAAPASDVDFEPRSVRVSGPRLLVRRLRAVHPFSLSLDHGDSLQHVADLDTSGTGVRIEPSQVKVRVRARTTAMSAAATASVP